MIKILTRMERQTARMADSFVLSSDHEDGQPDEPLVGGNVASQLNRLQTLRLIHVVRS